MLILNFRKEIRIGAVLVILVILKKGGFFLLTL